MNSNEIEFDYVTQWKEIRYLVLKRDNFTCQTCGKVTNCVDHLDPTTKRVNLQRRQINRMSQLQTLCRDCNLLKKKRTQEQWLNSSVYKKRKRRISHIQVQITQYARIDTETYRCIECLKDYKINKNYVFKNKRLELPDFCTGCRKFCWCKIG